MNGSPDRWTRVREILEAALDLEASERPGFLEESCGGDQELLAEVESLLASAEDTTFLETPISSMAAEALDEAAKEKPIGQRVGRYRLVEWLARGGMGDVYKAERDDGAFERTVAVKLVRGVLPTDALAKRFVQERKILASLNHPNIAHLHDGGLSDLGPYLAMEFVNGQPLHRHCDEKALDINSRVELFADVCEAVQSAHQRLIVHRDLKPSNVFVTREGRVKLLDFGIASLLEADGEGDEPLTRTGAQLMTPEYASPEQIRGEPASTVSDVYSLGVLLYELLTGRRPYDLRGLSPATIERRVAEESHPRPSDVVMHRGVAPVTGDAVGPLRSSQERATRPDKLRRRLKGDLDTIVRKAMHRDPDQRYPSAADLATDLRRHLANKPVLARPETLTYRFSTFVRRHPTGVAATLLIGLAIVVGSVATNYQARRAQARFEGTRSLANSMLRELSDALEDLPGGTPVRVMLVTQALTYLDELRGDPRADDELLLEIADAYAQIGAVQGNPHYTNLGDVASSRESYETALDLRSRVWTQNTNDPVARMAVAESYAQLAVLTAAEQDLTESNRLAELAMELLAPLEATHGNDDEYRKKIARLHSVLGGNKVFGGEFDAGLAELEESVAMYEDIAPRHPDDLQLRLDLWQAYANQMDGWRFSGRFEPALDVLEEEACPMLTRLESRYPTRPAVLYGLHECYDYLGTLQEHLGIPRAEASYGLGLEKAHALRELDPANERANLAVGISLLSIGRLMFLEDRPAEGRPVMEEALEVRQAMRELHPESIRWVRMVATAQRELCRGLLHTGDPEGAVQPCLDAIQTHEENIERDRAGAIAEVTLAFALGHTGKAHRALALKAVTAEEEVRLLREAEGFFVRSLEAYARADLPDDSVWEIPPEEIESDLSTVRRRLQEAGGTTRPRS